MAALEGTSAFPQPWGGKERIFLEKHVKLKGLFLLKASPVMYIDNVFVRFSLFKCCFGFIYFLQTRPSKPPQAFCPAPPSVADGIAF